MVVVTILAIGLVPYRTPWLGGSPIRHRTSTIGLDRYLGLAQPAGAAMVTLGVAWLPLALVGAIVMAVATLHLAWQRPFRPATLVPAP